MTDDDDDRVRYQLAFSLGEFPAHTERNQALARLAIHDGDKPYPMAAILSSLTDGAGDVLSVVVGHADRARSSDKTMILESLAIQLAIQIGRQLQPQDVKALEAAVNAARIRPSPAAEAIVSGYLAGRLKASPTAVQRVPLTQSIIEVKDDILVRAQRVAVDDKGSDALRIAAVGRLKVGSFAESRAIFAALVDIRQPRAVQSAAVKTLESFDDVEIGTWLLDRWPQFAPQVRGVVAAAIFSRPAWVRAFLTAVERGTVSLSEFDPARIRLLESSPDSEIRTGYQKLAARVTASPRHEVIAAYRPALDMAGDPGKGREQFRRVCAQCHRVEGVGHELGPNLAAFKARGSEAVLINVLDPNREVNPMYVNYVAQLDDGRTVTGMITDESAASVTLKRAENAIDTLSRGEIEMLRSTGQSIMPEGLERQLDLQAVADLLAYLNALP